MRGVTPVFLALLLAGCSTLWQAPAPPMEDGYAAEEVAGGFGFVAQFTFAPDGRLFVTERRAGDVVVVDEDGSRTVFAHFDVAGEGEQGLLGVALHPEFPEEPWVYVYHTFREDGRFWNRVVRTDGAGRSEVLLDRIPGGVYHDGGALAFDPEGMLWVTTGDGHEEGLAQDPDSLAGKVHRLTPEGEPAPGTPFGPGNPAVTMGHRNVFGITFDARGRAWATDNGPAGDDEVNLLVAGGNYGWPEVMGRGGGDRFVDPVWVWQRTVAPTGLAVPGPAYPGLEGDLVVGSWIGGHLRHLHLDDEGRVTRETGLATLPEGVTDVETGPDGLLYASTPNAVYRLNRGAS